LFSSGRDEQGSTRVQAQQPTPVETAVAFAAGSQHSPAASAASVVPQHGDTAGAATTGSVVLASGGALEQQGLVVESRLSVIVGLLA
jgi:hypothetical protein